LGFRACDGNNIGRISTDQRDGALEPTFDQGRASCCQAQPTERMPPVRSTIVVTAPPDVKQQRVVARLRKWLRVASSGDRIKRILDLIEKIGGVDARIEAQDAVRGGR